MIFIEKIFDIKKCARALRKHPGRPTDMRDFDALTPEELNPLLYPVYIQILRDDTINIANLNFGAIGEGDIDELENVLYYSPANRLFEISEVFRQFAPSSADSRVFI